MGTIDEALTPEFRARLQELGIDAVRFGLLVFSVQDLADGASAGYRFTLDGSRLPLIVVNGRMLVDPERVAHDLAEELAHAQQHADGVDFEAQQAQTANYDLLPYEQDARSLADSACGYGLPHIPMRVLRPEPPGVRRPHGTESTLFASSMFETS